MQTKISNFSCSSVRFQHTAQRRFPSSRTRDRQLRPLMHYVVSRTGGE